MLLSITDDTLGKFNEECLPTWNIYLEKSFLTSIIWLGKIRIHFKININFTVGHLTTGEY